VQLFLIGVRQCTDAKLGELNYLYIMKHLYLY